MRNAFQKCAAWIAFMIPFAAFLLSPSVALAGLITLGSAQSFAVLGSSTVTNTGPTTIVGNLGLYPGSSITDLADITLTGTVHNDDAVAAAAQTDLAAAYAALALSTGASDLSGQDLGTVGMLTPGVYSFSSSAQLTGTLTLNAQGNPNARFVFLIGTALTTANDAIVDVTHGGAGTGVFWLLGVSGGAGTGSATLGTGTAFAGNILALDSVTLVTGATMCGRALALNAAVTMDTNTISDACGLADFGSAGFAGNGVPVNGVPEPGTVPLFCVGLLALSLYGWQLRKRVA